MCRLFITEGSKAVLLVWFSLLFAIDVRFYAGLLIMFAHYTFSSVWVAEWPPFGK